MEQGRKGKGMALAGTQQPKRCPRCQSTSTKFCYFNNHSLSQPRHFCKACRRYWTEGGALRNVAQCGGGVQRGKHTKKTPTAASLSSGAANRDNLMSLLTGTEGVLPLSPPVQYFFTGGRTEEGLQRESFQNFHSGDGITADCGKQSAMMPMLLPRGLLNFPSPRQPLQQNLLLPIKPNLMIYPSLVPSPRPQLINTCTTVFATTSVGPTVSTATAAGVVSGEEFWLNALGNGGL